MYYISKAPNGNAMVSHTPPKGKPYVTMDKLPDGEGMLMIDDYGRVYRVPFPTPVPDPMAELAEKVTENSEAHAALEDAVCEMDALTEERLAAIEDALCEMDMG